MTPMKRYSSRTARRGAWLLGLVWLGLAAAAPAAPQDLSGLPGLQGGDQTVEVVPEPVKVAVHHSPRAAMKAFLDAMRRYWFQQSFDKADLAQALSTFDLRGVELTDDQRRDLAIRLYETLNRVAVVDLRKFPSSALASSVSVSVRDQRGLGKGLKVEFVRIAGGAETTVPENWRIAKTTLEQVPDWWEEYKERSVLKELGTLSKKEEQDLSLMQTLGFKLEQAAPESLRAKLFLLENWQWIALALVSLFGVLLGRVVSFLMRRFSTKLGSSEKLEIDKAVLAGFERPFSLFVMVWIVLFSRPALRLELVYANVLDLSCAFFLAITGVWSAFRLVDVFASILLAQARRTSNRFDDMLVPLLRRSAKVFLTFVGVIYVVSYFSEDLYGIVAGLSIGSLAVGFAAKDSIENLFGTVTVLLDKPYQLGDWVRFGDIDGSVESVGFRSTKIRTFYNSVITVPNSRFIATAVDNMGARRYRRIKTMISIAYGTPPLRIEAFCEALRELIRKHPYTRKDYYHVYLNDLAASSLDVLLYCFVMTPDWATELREKHRLYLDILKVAEGLGVEIAFPTQTIHVAGESEPLEPLAEDASGAERMGRELADLIVKEGLERFDGERPGKVVID